MFLVSATRVMNSRHLKIAFQIVETLALLTTELSSYKICKVGMLFCFQWALI